MKFCMHCGSQVPQQGKFCPDCGGSLQASAPGRTRSTEPPAGGRPRRDEAQGSPEGVERYRAVLGERREREDRLFRKLRWGAAAAVALALALHLTIEPSGLALAAGVAIAFLWAISWIVTAQEIRFTQLEYSRLPGAVGEGGHRCVHCGHRGVYRHTPYRTNTTLADCSRCKTPLWREAAR